MAEPNQVPKIWEAAIRQYEDATEKKLDDSTLRSLTTVGELVGAVEKQNQGFQDFRQKRRGLYAVLSAAMGPIELVGSAASQAAATVFPAGTYVFAAVQYLIAAAKGVSEKYDAIVEVLKTLKDFTVRLAAYARHEMSGGLQSKMAEILAVVLEILGISQAEMKHGRLFAFGKSLIMATDKGKEAIQKLNKLFDSEKGLVGAETLSEVKGVAKAVDKLNADISDLSKVVDSLSMHTQQEQDPLMKIRAILEPSSSSEIRYQTLKRNTVPNTAVWIRDEPIFNAWLSDKESIIWISGNPGAGKSYIATSVITDLTAAHPKGNYNTPNVSVGYFFFKDDDRRTRSFRQALRDIAYMISQGDSMYARHILSTCDSPEDVSTLSEAWQRLFASYFINDRSAPLSNNKAFIVLDGLDEAFEEDRIEFFELARDIGPSDRLQVAMLGRPQVMDEIERHLEMPGVPTIHVTAESNSLDIGRYIRSTISKTVYLKKASKPLLNEITKELSMKAQGMFIWVDFMLKSISKMRTEAAIRKALQEAPRGLHEMIRHVLEGFSLSLLEFPDTLQDLNEILMWVTCASRPLRLGEVENVLRWKSESGDRMIGLERSLRTQFASFFTLKREDGLTTADLHRIQREASVKSDEGGASGSASAAEEDWDEAEDEFDSDQLNTEITFNHASIGDFFRSDNEPPVSGGKGTMPVGVDIIKAKIWVLCSCLKIISCEPGSAKESIAAEIRLYAESAWLELLQGIDITKTSKEDKETVAQCLSFAMKNGAGFASVPMDGNLQLFRQKNLAIFKLWLQQSSSPEIRAWCSQVTVANDADLLDGAIHRIGKRWLSTEDQNWLLHVRAVAAFLVFRGGEEPSLATLSAESILECANWLSLDQDAVWHRRLGATLRDLGYYKEAMEQFQKAAVLIPEVEQWPLRHSKSWVYVEMREYETAVGLDVEISKELEALREAQGATELNKWDTDLHKVCHRLAFCYRELKKEEEELDVLARATLYDSRCYVCLKFLIRSLWPRQRFEEIATAFLRTDKKLPDKDYTGLTEALLTGQWSQDVPDFKYTAVAAFASGRLPALIDAYQRATVVARKEHKIVATVGLELSVAVIYDKGIKQREEGSMVYKRVLDTYGSARVGWGLVSNLSSARCALGSYLITRAVDVGPLSEEGLEYGRQIEELAAKKLRLAIDENVPDFANRERDMELYEKAFLKTSTSFMADGICHFFLGVYYKLAGRIQESISQFGEAVRGCLVVLGNEDISDDFSAYEVLLKILAIVSGPEEATAIFYLSWASAPQFEQLWAERRDWRSREHEGGKTTWQLRANSFPKAVVSQSDRNDNEVPDTPQLVSWNVDKIECDACWRDFKQGQWEHHYLCYYCGGKFCSDCHAKLLNKTYDGPTCSMLHDWFVVKAPPEDLTKNWQAGKLLLRGEWVDVEDWKNDLRKQFPEK